MKWRTGEPITAVPPLLGRLIGEVFVEHERGIRKIQRSEGSE